MAIEFLQVFHVKIDKNRNFSGKNEFVWNFSIFNGFYLEKLQKLDCQSISGVWKQYIYINWAVLREKMGSKISFSQPGLKNSMPEKPPKCNFK